MPDVILLGEVYRQLGISVQTYFRWKKPYAGLGIPAFMLGGGLIGLPLSFAVMRLGVIQERKKEVSF